MDVAARPLVVGANHRSSTLAVRDRLFVEESALPILLGRLGGAGVTQALVVATCERVDVIAADPEPPRAAAAVVTVLATHAEMEIKELSPHLYVLSDGDAVRHVLTVAASLDSATTGDPYVLGQMRGAHEAARRAGTSGSALEALMRAAYAAAKRVRNETTIAQRPASIAAAAVEIARDVFGDLSRLGGLLVGSGEMGEFLMRGFSEAGVDRVVVAHPRIARAEQVAGRLDCHVAAFDALPAALSGADIVVVAHGSRHYVVTAELVRAGLKARRGRPVLIVDAAFPGDVEPAVEALDGAFCYSLDDLETIAWRGRQERRSDAARARDIVEAEVQRFFRERAQRGAAPVLRDFSRHLNELREQALADAGGDGEKATRLLIGRLLHLPAQVLKTIAASGEDGHTELRALEQALARLFGLDERRDEER